VEREEYIMDQYSEMFGTADNGLKKAYTIRNFLDVLKIPSRKSDLCLSSAGLPPKKKVWVPYPLVFWGKKEA
jgi:hypothetical protein